MCDGAFANTDVPNDSIDRPFVIDAPVHFVKTGIDLVASPLQWDKRDWLIFGSATAFTAASIYYFDLPVNRFLVDKRIHLLNKTLVILDPFDIIYPIIGITGFAATGLIAKSNYHLETAFMLAESCFYNALLTKGVKRLADRTRPNYWRGPDPLYWHDSTHGRSFYSGHTSMAFAMASVIAWRYRDTNWVPWVSYGVATMAGLQRLYYNRHWMSDVFVGAATATAIGLFIAKNDKQNPLKLYPVVSPQVTGLSMVVPIR